MWIEILCGLVVYKVFRRFFFGDVEVSDVGTGSSELYFTVADRLEKIYGGKAYVGLRIPDPETSSRQHIDVVLVTKREVMVVAVRNFSGFVAVGDGGNWVCTKDKKHKPETFPDPVRLHVLECVFSGFRDLVGAFQHGYEFILIDLC